MTPLVGVLLVVLVFLVFALVAFQFLQRAGRRREAGYVKRLEESHEYLQHHISRLDGLVAMLAGLYRLGMSGAAPSERVALCEVVVQSACRLLQARGASLFLREGDGQTLTLAAAHGWPEEFSARWAASGPKSSALGPEDKYRDAPTVRLGEGIIGRVAETGKTLSVEDLRSDRRFLREPDAPLESRCMTSVALRTRDRVVGVLTIQDDAPRLIEERESRLLGILADHAALTLDNFDLYRSLRKFNIDLVQTLVQALNAKEAGGGAAAASRAPVHARRVAVAMNLPEQAAQFIEYAAMMRGIGKIGVSDAILRKPGKLTADEYAAVKRHPRIGSQILSPLSLLAPVAPIVLYHQEWFNGQGYPDGLAGEEIPLGARIVAVVSVWEAMTSERPYRKALTRAEALEEIRKGSGTQFDPKVVDVFLSVLREEESAPAGAGAGK